jgi:predicted phage terminase large subunit-like protein
MDTADLFKQLSLLPQHKQVELLNLVNELERVRSLDGARKKFLPFVKYLWPDFVEGGHHRIIAKLFDDVVEGRKKRVIINMAPRHTKSEFASVFLPAYFLGRYPRKKVIETSHTAELAVGFGRKVRGIINGAPFQELFPEVHLSQDSKAAGRWATSKGGEYFAIGVGGAVAGKGADLLVIDDPHSEQDAIIGESNPEVYKRVMEWYEGGPRQRLQPGGAIIVVMTRWSLRDLTGQLLKKQLEEKGADQWELIELPALLPERIDLENNTVIPERPIWPEFWKLEELLKTKASIPISKWSAQYQQKPTSEEGALIKREFWRDWEADKFPKMTTIIQSWDTAFSKGTRADYSACTTWGVFESEEDGTNQIMLINAERGKWEFPELKKKALELYERYEVDICLIEARAAGMPLIFELRQMGIPIQDVVVGRGSFKGANDKIARVNAVTDIFASKRVWAKKRKQFAQEVIEECAAFPAGEHDDYVDTVTQALTRFRQGGWIGTENDYEEDDEEYVRRRRYEYY